MNYSVTNYQENVITQILTLCAEFKSATGLSILSYPLFEKHYLELTSDMDMLDTVEDMEDRDYREEVLGEFSEGKMMRNQFSTPILYSIICYLVNGEMEMEDGYVFTEDSKPYVPQEEDMHPMEWLHMQS